ncbi:hypothetical protein GCM10025777_47120 [Membranihabitans marinus]
MCNPSVGTCGYCKTENIDCVDAKDLAQWFEPLMSTYEVADDGEPIVRLLAKEWDLFRGSGMNEAERKELLADVLDDGEIVRKLFRPIENPKDSNLQDWDDLRDEMMHRNRWFLDKPMNAERMEGLLSRLIAPSVSLNGVTWYRARLMSNDKPYELSQMGAPPRHKAGHGRANPAGIPYLYLGSTQATAVAELRPHTGENACVAEFTIPDLNFADLRNPRQLLSPLLGDESEILKLRADLPLLERLGEELTRPVQPRGAPYEYIPTQYLCEYIKTRGFDGVIYRSSVTSDDGINLALFDPSIAQAQCVEQVSVEKVSVSLGRPSGAALADPKNETAPQTS